jgi:hypothetical protein
MTVRAHSSLGIIASLTLSAAIGYLAFLVAKHAVVHAAESKAPFTAEIETDMYSGSGQRDFVKRTSYYRFGDGSVVYRMTDVSPKQQPGFTQIMNAGTGSWIFLDPLTFSAIEIKRSVEGVRQRIAELDREESCPANLSSLPDGGEMFGVATVREIIRETEQTDKYLTMEKWIAPALNCFPLKEIDTSALHGGAHNLEIVTSLRRGEPDGTLLNIPAGYVIASPLEVEKTHREQTGADFLGPAISRKLQREYDSAH